MKKTKGIRLVFSADLRSRPKNFGAELRNGKKEKLELWFPLYTATTIDVLGCEDAEGLVSKMFNSQFVVHMSRHLGWHIHEVLEARSYLFQQVTPHLSEAFLLRMNFS